MGVLNGSFVPLVEYVIVIKNAIDKVLRMAVRTVIRTTHAIPAAIMPRFADFSFELINKFTLFVIVK